MSFFSKKQSKQPTVRKEDVEWIEAKWPQLGPVVADTLRQLGSTEDEISNDGMYAAMAPSGEPENIWMHIERMCLSVVLTQTSTVIRQDQGDAVASGFVEAGSSGRSAAGQRNAIRYLLGCGIGREIVGGYGEVASQALSAYRPELLEASRQRFSR